MTAKWMGDTSAQRCECGGADDWAKDPSVPVRFDTEFNEYHIITGEDDGTYHLMYYCFMCGGRLPESKRDDFFSKPSEAEQHEIRGIEAQVHCIDDALSALGDPDKSSEWHEPRYAPAKLVRWKRALTYLHRWKSLVLTVTEWEDGSLSFTVTGKFLGKQAEGNTEDDPP